jgi:hypothetical protein
MDSLREILDLPARVDGTTAEDVSLNIVERVADRTSSPIRRKRGKQTEETIDDESPSQPDVKRGRIMEDGKIECERQELSPRKPGQSPEVGLPGKRISHLPRCTTSPQPPIR